MAGMTAFEKFHRNRLCAEGCAACGTFADVCWHHFIHKINGGRMTRTHLLGLPLCRKCHQDGPDALHKHGDENEWIARFCRRDKQTWVGEIVFSALDWMGDA